MKRTTIVNIKGDDHKTKGRIGHNLTLEISIWGGAIAGAITTVTGLSNLLVEEDDKEDT